MKKEELKYKFIELRAAEYTYERICNEIKITKPTAIKWGKIFSQEIERQQKYLISDIFSERIVEQEQGIMVRLEQFRRKGKMNLSKKMSSRFDNKILKGLEKIFIKKNSFLKNLYRTSQEILKGLEKIFIKKIKAVHLKLNEDCVTNAVFFFDDDLIIEEKAK